MNSKRIFLQLLVFCLSVLMLLTCVPFVAVGDVQLQFMGNNVQNTDELFMGSFVFLKESMYFAMSAIPEPQVFSWHFCRSNGAVGRQLSFY